MHAELAMVRERLIAVGSNSALRPLLSPDAEPTTPTPSGAAEVLEAIAALAPTCQVPTAQGAATYEIFYEAGAAASGTSHEEMVRVSRLQVLDFDNTSQSPHDFLIFYAQALEARIAAIEKTVGSRATTAPPPYAGLGGGGYAVRDALRSLQGRVARLEPESILAARKELAPLQAALEQVHSELRRSMDSGSTKATLDLFVASFYED